MEGNNFKNGQQFNGQQNQKGNNGVAQVNNNTNSFGKTGAKWVAAGLGLAGVTYVVYRVCKKFFGKKAEEKKTEAPEAPADK